MLTSEATLPRARLDADYTARLPALNRARDTAAQNYTGLYGRAARALLASV